MAAAASVDEYLAGFSGQRRVILERVRATVAQAAPAAVETISYGLPTFKMGRAIMHFAGMKNHLGVYPMPAAIQAFAARLAGYQTSKGAVQFPWDQPIPLELIAELTRFNVEHLAKVDQ
ncbi:MAG: DUF1801 domain-containing protein [Propionibacteriaceae bacterium]|jgi:uncharacterized protein YdhG (YjbR/CyaY superfamily)|nr:DUF1801 domain-containing protein [Propionibacteriaceae bacterium]